MVYVWLLYVHRNQTYSTVQGDPEYFGTVSRSHGITESAVLPMLEVSAPQLITDTVGKCISGVSYALGKCTQCVSYAVGKCIPGVSYAVV